MNRPETKNNPAMGKRLTAYDCMVTFVDDREGKLTERIHRS